MKVCLKRYFVLYLLAAFIFILFTGCAGKTGGGDVSEQEQEASDGPVNLSVYILMPYDPAGGGSEYQYRLYPDYVQNMLDNFNTSSPEARVEITGFYDPETYIQRLSQDLRSGTGPDVVLFSAGSFDRNYMELVEAGLLDDLNPYIENDRSEDRIDLSKWPSQLTALFETGNTRPALPVNMRVDVFFTGDDSKLDIDAVSETAIVDALISYADHTEFTPEKHFLINHSVDLSVWNGLLRATDSPWWNKDEKTTRFDSPEFKVAVGKGVTLAAKNSGYAFPLAPGQYQSGKAGGVIIGGIGTYLGWNHAAFFDGKGYTAAADVYAAVSAGSAHKDAAYGLIKFMVNNFSLSLNGSITPDPARIRALNEKENKELEKSATLSSEDIIAKITYNEFITEVCTNITTVLVPDSTVERYLDEMLADIVQNGVSVDDAISELQRNTMEYFNK